MDTYRPCPGDVVSYTPESTWCHEGIAIVQDPVRHTGCYQMLDTYWGTQPSEISDAEASTAELMFKLADYDELDRYSSHASQSTWDKYAPVDRQLITSQHGLQKRWFIRKGASPDWATQISNAQGVVSAHVDELESAQRRLQWARDDLASVIADAKAVGFELANQEGS